MSLIASEQALWHPNPFSKPMQKSVYEILFSRGGITNFRFLSHHKLNSHTQPQNQISSNVKCLHSNQKDSPTFVQSRNFGSQKATLTTADIPAAVAIPKLWRRMMPRMIRAWTPHRPLSQTLPRPSRITRLSGRGRSCCFEFPEDGPISFMNSTKVPYSSSFTSFRILSGFLKQKMKLCVCKSKRQCNFSTSPNSTLIPVLFSLKFKTFAFAFTSDLHNVGRMSNDRSAFSIRICFSINPQRN